MVIGINESKLARAEVGVTSVVTRSIFSALCTTTSADTCIPGSPVRVSRQRGQTRESTTLTSFSPVTDLGLSFKGSENPKSYTGAEAMEGQEEGLVRSLALPRTYAMLHAFRTTYTYHPAWYQCTTF